MRDLNSWLREYKESHTHPVNVTIHKFAVPLIMWSIIGLLWCIPIPSIFPAEYFVNWATLFIALCLVFYLILSLKMFIGMLILTSIFIFICAKLDDFSQDILLYSSIVVFIVAWVFQFIGHKYEGKKPSFFKDIFFLLIGPLWVLNSFFGLVKK